MCVDVVLLQGRILPTARETAGIAEDAGDDEYIAPSECVTRNPKKKGGGGGEEGGATNTAKSKAKAKANAEKTGGSVNI